MDQPTCYTVIALLTALSGTLLYLLYRRGQPIGEYRQIRPELPPPGALAEDLHDAFRRGCPMVVGAILADDLPGCSDSWRSGVQAQVAHLYRSLRGETLIALLLLGLLSACTPLQQQAARDRAAAGALDFAVCAGQQVAQPLVNGLAAAIDGSPTWRADLLGATAPAVSCALLALVQQLRQDAAATGEAGVAARATALQVDPAAQVRQLAERCERGPCTDLRERAAWLLVKGQGQGGAR